MPSVQVFKMDLNYLVKAIYLFPIYLSRSLVWYVEMNIFGIWYFKK